MPIPSPLGTQKALITSPIPLIIPNISCGIGQRPEFPLQSDEKREVAPAFGCLPMIGSSPSIEGEGFTCSRSEPKALPIPAKAAVGMTGPTRSGPIGMLV